MKIVSILKWRDALDNIYLKDEEGKVHSLNGTMQIDTPLISNKLEHWWGNLECDGEGEGSWILETSDRKTGKLRKRGE